MENTKEKAIAEAYAHYKKHFGQEMADHMLQTVIYQEQANNGMKYEDAKRIYYAVKGEGK